MNEHDMSMEELDMPMDETPDADAFRSVISVLDDNGEEHAFEILDQLDTDEGHFLALLPTYDDPSELLNDDGELIILEVVEEDGKDMLAPILDDDKYDRIATEFEERLSEYYEIESLEPLN